MILPSSFSYRFFSSPLFLSLFLFGLHLLFTPVMASANYDLSIFLMNGETPITTSQDIRISLWDVYDVRDEDFDEGDGSINTSATHYGGYNTEITVTPNDYGKVHIYMGDLPSFPALSPFNAYLHIEYKDTGDLDTDYVTYDFIDDPPYQNVTRYLLDANAGGYYTLDAGPRTNWNTFTLDANNSAATQVRLQFGETLAEYLDWNVSNARFEFSDDLAITGGLSATTNVDFSSASQFFVPQGSSDPGTCAVGQEFYNTTSNQKKLCTAVNTWEVITLGTHVDHLFIDGQSASTSYSSVGSFVFAGTNTEPDLSSFKGSLKIDSGATSYSAQIYDLTNSQVIAEVTGQTNTSTTVVDFGSISNLPSSAAIFEIQVKRVGGLLQNVYCDALTIVY